MKTQQRMRAQRGFSLIELVVVVAVAMIVAAIAVPNIIQAFYTVRLRSSAGELAGLMQKARLTATKSNKTYAIKYTTLGTDRAAYVDLNQNGAVDTGEPVVVFGSGVAPAASAPSGTGGQPPAYVLTGDTSPNPAYDNTNTLAFNPRGLPCNYDTPPACLTPSASYFVYYLSSTHGWVAVVITRSGRTKTVTWNGTQWND